MNLSLIAPLACLVVFAGLLSVSRPRKDGVSRKILENGLVQVLLPVFLLALFVAGAGGLFIYFD
jgi:hypothetical protein